ncbi:hypothetical protein BDV25DRAFT_40579 [Aspergillus avenaceus]|uniref:Uncharacterized protein n=1 Tax=Aspergillus avenaceus TaxID=36643 RepID=A0A5N6TL38_ASPAV|nr:hypothetical protein BDV25DRAFT_40579 [Aspergillus avenaceus]
MWISLDFLCRTFVTDPAIGYGDTGISVQNEATWEHGLLRILKSYTRLALLLFLFFFFVLFGIIPNMYTEWREQNILISS